MQNLKFHIINTAAVVLFSYILAFTISQFIRLNITPAYTDSIDKRQRPSGKSKEKTFEDYKAILDATFFKVPGETVTSEDSETPVVYTMENSNNLILLGTITGPSSIARALIKKKGEKDSQVFKLWSDVYGFKLVRIDNSKIYLKQNENIEIIDMYTQKEDNQSSNRITNTKPDSDSGPPKSQTISRSEIQQKVLNNLDNALKGLRAGPYRVNGKVEGYKLFRVSPSNILYRLGARSGDIARRINGHAIDSTEKLMGLWQSIQGESKISIDLERGGKIETFEINLTD
ncbi:MAG: hypothetical protein JW864_07410 [Spirochaetes bacterium]|nr:hypothetical protein [Spirochaetota bacterium]